MQPIIRRGHFYWCPTRLNTCSCKLYGYGVAASLALGVGSVEFWGSNISESLSLLSDAWHMLSDCPVYLVAGVAFFLKRKHPLEALKLDNKGGKFISWVLTIIAIFTLGNALYRLFDPILIVSGLALKVAGVGFVTNLVMFALLHALHIDHENGEEAHNDETHYGAVIHTLIDTGLSLVAIFAISLRHFFPESSWTLWSDPFGSIVICCCLLYMAHMMRQRIRDRGH